VALAHSTSHGILPLGHNLGRIILAIRLEALVPLPLNARTHTAELVVPLGLTLSIPQRRALLDDPDLVEWHGQRAELSLGFQRPQNALDIHALPDHVCRERLGTRVHRFVPRRSRRCLVLRVVLSALTVHAVRRGQLGRGRLRAAVQHRAERVLAVCPRDGVRGRRPGAIAVAVYGQRVQLLGEVAGGNGVGRRALSHAPRERRGREWRKREQGRVESDKRGGSREARVQAFVDAGGIRVRVDGRGPTSRSSSSSPNGSSGRSVRTTLRRSGTNHYGRAAWRPLVERRAGRRRRNVPTVRRNGAECTARWRRHGEEGQVVPDA
jgi:hypothetical protein